MRIGTADMDDRMNLTEQQEKLLDIFCIVSTLKWIEIAEYKTMILRNRISNKKIRKDE